MSDESLRILRRLVKLDPSVKDRYIAELERSLGFQKGQSSLIEVCRDINRLLVEIESQITKHGKSFLFDSEDYHPQRVTLFTEEKTPSITSGLAIAADPSHIPQAVMRLTDTMIEDIVEWDATYLVILTVQGDQGEPEMCIYEWTVYWD